VRVALRCEAAAGATGALEMEGDLGDYSLNDCTFHAHLFGPLLVNDERDLTAMFVCHAVALPCSH